MPKEKLDFQGLFEFRSRKWFWPFFTGAFLGLGYSSTKNILVSKIDTKQSNQENLNRFFSQEEYISSKNYSPKSKEKKLSKIDITTNIKHKNSLNQLNKHRNNSLTKELKVPKKINIIISDNSYLSFTIEFSEKINNMNQSAYKKNLAFFQEHDVDNLMKSLDNPKITKSPKIRAEKIDS